MLTGQLRPSIGAVEVLGINAARDPQKLKANIGIVPESESPPSYLPPSEFLQFVGKLRGVDDIDAKVSQTKFIAQVCQDNPQHCLQLTERELPQQLGSVRPL